MLIRSVGERGIDGGQAELFELLLLDFQSYPSPQALVNRLQDGLDALRAARTKIEEHESRARLL